MQNFPVRDSDLVPEDYQMRLMAWRDEFTRGYFEIGDIANDIVMMNIKKKMKVENAMIYSAVGRFCGKSGRTVRDYAEISAFFPVEIRELYDVLPFSHFRFAKTCGRKWEDVLEYSLTHPDASEDKLAQEFLCGGGMSSVAAQQSPASVAASDAPDSVAASTVAASPSVAASTVAADLSGIYVLANLVSQAESMLSLNMNQGTRRKLILALEGLKDVLKELSEKQDILEFKYANLDER